VRAFCYLADAVAGFFTVLLRGAAGTAYNVGNPAGALSIRALADLLAGLGRSTPLTVTHAGRPAAGYLPSPIPVNVPDITRLRALGWQPARLPRDGFARTLAYFRDHETAA
jgi:UDP-glucuronate decarboxylase